MAVKKKIVTEKKETPKVEKPKEAPKKEPEMRRVWTEDKKRWYWEPVK